MIKVNIDLCSGCKRCMLACSLHKVGGFNPRFSSIEIITDIGNKPIAYNIKFCTDCKDLYCLDFCMFGALEACI